MCDTDERDCTRQPDANVEAIIEDGSCLVWQGLSVSSILTLVMLSLLFRSRHNIAKKIEN